ncbi:hypothetical protein [Marivita sp.]|uniref:hypothetical protein n=1 Tax=Marivita sp. TaxID=2003365 RepID=UPI003F723E5F
MTQEHLTCSVGLGGINLSKDLTEVRFLLDMQIYGNSRFRDACSGAGLLNGDGLSLKQDPDPNAAAFTGSAVVQFQQKVMWWSLDRCDGRVDPRGKTWTALTAAVGAGGIAPVDVTPTLPAIGDALSNAGFKAYNQGSYKTQTLGYQNKGKDVTISQEGCFLCTMTMAATGIGRPTSVWPAGVLAKDLTPVHANDIAKNNACYTTAGLNPFALAPLLGMKISRFGLEKGDSPLPANPVAHVDGHIGAGGVVAAHVDYKDKHEGDFTKGDHWVLITNKASDSGFRDYDALDPSGGAKMGMSKNLAVNPRELDYFLKWLNDYSFQYKKGYLFGIPSPKSGIERQEFQKNYRMVRYCLLSRS